MQCTLITEPLAWVLWRRGCFLWNLAHHCLGEIQQKKNQYSRRHAGCFWES